jgi:hypothetical protein
MNRKWIFGAGTLIAIAATAVGASSVLGGGSEPRPDYATVDVRVDPVAGPAGLGERKAKKPQVLYLQGPESTVDVDATGPYIDVRLFSCPANSRVIDGGVFPDNTNVYEQGSYIPNSREYHVLLGFDDDGPATNFNITSHLVCLKRVK